MMTPRSRRPVLLISGTNLNKLPTTTIQPQKGMDDVEEEINDDSNVIKKCKMDENIEEPSTNNSIVSNASEANHSLTTTFKEYLNSRGNLTETPVITDENPSSSIESPTDLSFSSRTDDYNSSNIRDLSSSKLSSSLLYCLDGNLPLDNDDEEKQLVLKPKQFDKNGKPTIFETSF